jgi:hypothetical protein
MSKIIAGNIAGAGLGNKMFINALAYIISLKTGKELFTTPIEFFNNTKKNTNANTITNPLYTKQYGDQNINIEEILNHSGDIIINSFVQRQEYYTNYRNELRNFFYEAYKGGVKHNNTVLYIRNGDYKDIGVYLGVDNYYRLLDNINFTHLTIVTEHIDKDVELIAQKYNADIFSKSVFEDFLYIKNADSVIMSQSTFSWWAAFLGAPKKVHVPLSVKGVSKGWWYISPGTDDIDLSLKYSNYNYIILK